MTLKNHFQINRRLLNHPLWLSEPFTKGQAWVDLIGDANHADGYLIKKGQRVDVLRGQTGTAMLTFARRWRWSRGKVKRFFVWLERERMIEQQNGHLTTVTTICNYDRYQLPADDNGTSKRTSNGHLTGHQTDIKRTSDGTQTIRIKKKEKEERKKEKYKKEKFSEAFSRWWKSYPMRNGRRAGKARAAKLFEKIPQSDWNDLKTATANYTLECNGLPKDPERFLRDDFWRDFIKPPDKSKPRNGERPRERSVKEIADAMVFREDGQIDLIYKDENEKRDCDYDC